MPLRVAVVAPACRLPPEAAESVDRLARSDYGARAEIFFHPQCFLSDGHFAGPDAARAAALLEVANDPTFDALWLARGGYGSCRLLELVAGKFGEAAQRKTYLGYSDNGALLGLLYRDGIGQSVHGPMPADIRRPGGEAAVRRALAYLVDRDPATLEPAARSGRKVAAFNIAILVHLLATPYAPDLSDHILMLEDVSEHHYRIDRALCAITSNANVRRAAGILLGRCSDIPDNDPPFQKTEVEIAAYWCARARIPYLGRADIGHDIENKVVPFGQALLA